MHTRKSSLNVWACHCTSTCVTLHGGQLKIPCGQKLFYCYVSWDGDVNIGTSRKNILSTWMNVFLYSVGQQKPRVHSSCNGSWISCVQPFSSPSCPALHNFWRLAYSPCYEVSFLYSACHFPSQLAGDQLLHIVWGVLTLGASWWSHFGGGARRCGLARGSASLGKGSGV